ACTAFCALRPWIAIEGKSVPLSEVRSRSRDRYCLEWTGLYSVTLGRRRRWRTLVSERTVRAPMLPPTSDDAVVPSGRPPGRGVREVVAARAAAWPGTPPVVRCCSGRLHG